MTVTFGGRTLPTASSESVSDAFRSDLPPVLVVKQGERFAVHARSILSDPSTNSRAGFEDLADYGHLGIPVTGPIEILGVRAGDVLRVDIEAIEIADEGAMVTLLGRGGFSEALEPAGRRIPIVDGNVIFDGIPLPVKKMVGKIGVGTPAAPHCSTVGPHGGNMDCPDVGEGSSLFLTVQADGGHLFLGDLHARQGAGEACVTAVEVEGYVVLTCQVVSGLQPGRPTLLNDERLITIGDGDDLDEAVRLSLEDMLELVKSTRGWSREDAAMFISIAADVGVCQVVNPRRSAITSIPLTWCRPEAFFDRSEQEEGTC